ncbi:MAG: Ig-like domain-containing protein, partial [bacterium]|nr:Ig-like domain-containing protein [bacterium]
SHPGLVHLRADGRADPAACFTLATSSMDWSWTTVQPAAGSAFASVDSDGQGRWCRTSDECAVVSCATAAACAPFGAGTACVDGRCAVNFCSANRCTFVPATPAGAPNLFSNTKTARGIRETPLAADGSPQPVEVRATVAAATPRTGTSNVVVRFEKPRVTAVYPTASCQAACPNGRVVAVTNIDLDPDTVTTGTTETTETVKLYACNQENCRRDELTAVGGTTIAAAACAASPPAGSFCATNKVGADPQIIISGVTPLETNKSYRVVIRDDVRSAWGVPLDQLNYADNASGALDSYSWTFRTRSEPCVVSRVDVSPSPLVLNVIGERATVRAVPFGQPDACSPAGQPLDAEAMDWVWSIANPPPGVVAQFTTVNSAGAFTAPASDQLTRTSRVAGPSCTLQCLRPGSRRVPGICGNGVTETPAEECERTGGAFASWCDPATCLLKGAKPEADGGTCGNGVINDGEECEEVGPDGALSATGQFPVWCDPATCLNRGSVVGGSVCGNGNAATPVVSAGDGEDCDDGNTNGGDGCSSTCLAEGTPRQYHATEAPNGILARCGDGVVADGQGTPPRPDGGEECDPGAVPRAIWTSQGCDYDRCVRTGARSIAEEITPGVFGTCGNGAVDVLKGEQCDDGAVGICNAASDVNAGRRCSAATSAADCGGASRCEELQPMDGDGCASNCLFEGSSIAWRHARTNAVQPSMCGDGYQPPERGEACDLGGITGPPDPLQIIQAIGSGTANAEGTQITAVTATVNGVPGPGEIRLQCGYESDVQCPNPDSVPAGIGVDRQGCCRARPTIAARIPGPATTGVCRNARITVRFDQQMDTGSLGAVTDLATGSSFMKGAVLERCKAGTACRSDVSADWETISAVPALSDAIIAVAGQDRTVSELSFTLTSALNPSTVYRVRVLDTSDDTAAQQLSIRSADGVRLGDATGNTWTFTTGTQVCTVSRIDVIPPSYLLQRRESRATLRAQAIAQT